MGAKKSARQHARERGALDGADAQALEHALTQTERERDEARQQLDRLIDSSAEGSLDWAVHNLVGHPLMQILTWLGKPELGVRVHDATTPRPDLYAPRSDER